MYTVLFNKFPTNSRRDKIISIIVVATILLAAFLLGSLNTAIQDWVRACLNLFG